jgi:hypothetical protein
MTIKILDIIHRPVFYLKHCSSETGLYLSLQAEYNELDAIEPETNNLLMIYPWDWSVIKSTDCDHILVHFCSPAWQIIMIVEKLVECMIGQKS